MLNKKEFFKNLRTLENNKELIGSNLLATRNFNTTRVYNYHTIIFIELKNGVTLMNNQYYSSTTSTNQSHLYNNFVMNFEGTEKEIKDFYDLYCANVLFAKVVDFHNEVYLKDFYYCYKNNISDSVFLEKLRKVYTVKAEFKKLIEETLKKDEEKMIDDFVSNKYNKKLSRDIKFLEYDNTLITHTFLAKRYNDKIVLNCFCGGVHKDYIVKNHSDKILFRANKVLCYQFDVLYNVEHFRKMYLSYYEEVKEEKLKDKMLRKFVRAYRTVMYSEFNRELEFVNDTNDVVELSEKVKTLEKLKRD